MSTELITDTRSLLRLSALMQQVGIPALLVGKESGSSINQIVITLDEKLVDEPEFTLHLAYLHDVTELEPDPENEYVPLQFFLKYPLKVEPAKLSDSYQLLNRFNSYLPFGYFTYVNEEEDCSLNFNYSLITERTFSEPEPILQAIEINQDFVIPLIEQFKAFQSSSKSVSEIIDETEKSLEG